MRVCVCVGGGGVVIWYRLDNSLKGWVFVRGFFFEGVEEGGRVSYLVHVGRFSKRVGVC